MMLSLHTLSVKLGGRNVLHSVSAEIAAGQVTGLIGPNGAGKTTLMRAAAGLVPFDGKVAIAGQPLAAFSHQERARRIAYLPQARTLAWPVSVADLVALGRLPWQRFGAKPGDADKQACKAAMQHMDVAHLASRKVTELSGGEQARVLAARAIAQNAPLLLADEPAAGLDPAHQIAMMQALAALARQGSAILVSLHDLALAARWCDRLLVLDKGGLAAQGEPEDVMTEGLLEGVFGIRADMRRTPDGLLLTPTGLASKTERAA